LRPIPNPQSPIPNPQSPYLKSNFYDDLSYFIEIKKQFEF